MNEQTATSANPSRFVVTFGGAVGFNELQRYGTIATELPQRAAREYGEGKSRVLATEMITGAGESKPADPSSLRLTFHAPAGMLREDIDTVKNLLKTSLNQAGLRAIEVDQDHHGVKISAILPLTQEAFSAGHLAIAKVGPQLQ